MSIDYKIIADNSQIFNSKLNGDNITGTIDVGNYNNVYISNSSANSITNTNVTTRQNAVKDKSFSENTYNRNIDTHEYYIKTSLDSVGSTMVDITELTMNLEVGWYKVEFSPLYDVDLVATGTGWDFGSGDAVLTNYSCRTNIPQTLTSNLNRNDSSKTSYYSSSASPSTTDNRATITANFKVTSAGTLIPRFRSENSNVVTLKKGSYLTLKKINIPS